MNIEIIEIIESYREADKDYSNILFTALDIVGEDKLISLLEEAERLGKRIELTYPIPFEVGPSDPNGVKLV